MRKKLTALLLALSPLLFAGVLDPGGVSMDLAKCAIPAETGAGPNLFVNPEFAPVSYNLEKLRFEGGWYLTVAPLGRDAAESARLRKECQTVEFLPKGGARELHFAQREPADANATRKFGAIAIRQFIRPVLPGDYAITFHARGHVRNAHGRRSFVRLAGNFYGADRKRITHLYKDVAVGDAEQLYSIVFTAPEGCAYAELTIGLYGLGELWLREPTCRANADTRGPIAELYPFAFMDRQFFLAQGQPCLMYFCARNPSGAKLEQPELLLTLPPGVELVAASQMLKVERDASAPNAWRLRLPANVRVFPQYTHKQSTLPPVILATSAPPGQRLPASVAFCNGGKLAAPSRFEIVTAPPIPKARRPQRYALGFNPIYMERFAPAPATRLGKFYADCGFTFASSAPTDEMAKAFHGAGLKVWGSTGPADGTRFSPKPQPESAWFLDLDGKPIPAHYNMGYAVCPVAIYRRSDYYVRQALPLILRRIAERDLDGSLNNWEPQEGMKGCYCEKCREEFIQFAKLPAPEVRAAWPKAALQRWRAELVRFRSWQSAQVLATVSHDVTDAARTLFGREVPWLPWMTSQVLAEETYERYSTYRSTDFIGKLPWVGVFGPYNYREMSQPYVHNNALFLPSWHIAKSGRLFLDRHLPKGAPRPKLLAAPLGIMMFSCVTAPEAIAMESCGFFLNQWNANNFYLFPWGLDHRYFRPLAQLAGDIAGAEKFVFDGKLNEQAAATPETPLPTTFYSRFGHPSFPGVNALSLLQTIAWRHVDGTLVAVGNYWMDGECFFRLRLPGLKTDARYHVILPREKALFTPDQGGDAFTGAELAKGILLQVGALRWNLYRVLPEGKLPPGFTRLPQRAVADACRQRLPAIRAACDREEKLLKNAGGNEEKPDYSNLPALRNAGLSAKCDGGLLTISSKRQTLLLDLAHGGKITSWLWDGTELAHPQGKYAFGVESTIGASKATSLWLDAPMRVLDFKAAGSGLELVLEHRITQGEMPRLAGLVVRKTLRIEDGRLRLQSRITNTTGDSLSVAFRYHNLPAAAAFACGGKTYPRIAGPQYFAFAGDTPAALGNPRRHALDAPAATLLDPKGTPLATITVKPASDFLGFHAWDGNIPFPTFEALFQPVTLTASLSHTWEMHVERPNAP